MFVVGGSKGEKRGGNWKIVHDGEGGVEVCDIFGGSKCNDGQGLFSVKVEEIGKRCMPLLADMG